MSTPQPPAQEAAAPARRPRFYRRRRFWAWSGVGVLAVVLCLLFAVYWLLQTVAGRDVLLAQIIARLPAGASLEWEKVEGPLAGPLTLHGLDFRYDDYHFTARRAYLDPDIRPLLGRRLRLDAFELEGAALEMASSEEPFELPRWPESLPAIEMPLAIQADTLVIDGLTVNSGGEHVIDIRHLRGGIDIASGRLHAQQLKVDTNMGLFALHGDYAPADNYRSDMLATAVFPAPRGQSAARLGLHLYGDLEAMHVAIGGRAPEPLRATVQLGGDRQAPRWSLAARSEGLDPGLFTGQPASQAPAYTFDIAASGLGGAMDLSGNLAQGTHTVTIAPSKISLDGQLLTVAPLRLEGFEGEAVLRGTADFREQGRESFRFSLVADGLRFQGTDPQVPAVGVDAALGLAGSLRRWASYGEATLTRGDEQAGLELDVRGDARRARIHALRARMPTGVLEVTGEAGWEPKLDWELAATLSGFDPGYFVPGWDGQVSGRLASHGQARDDAGFDADLAIDDLDGRLRGRALDGEGRLQLRGSHGNGSLELALGGSRVAAQGTVEASTMDVQASLQPLRLDDLFPEAGGSLQGTVQLRGPRTRPDLAAELDGSGLRWGDYSAERLALHGRLPWRGGGGALRLEGDGLEAGIAVRGLVVQAEGAVEDLRLETSLESPDAAAITLAGQLRAQGQGWRGSLDALRISPVRGDAWSLREPAGFSASGGRWQLQPACLDAGSGDAAARLCAQADWPRQGLQLHSDSLPLSLVHAWLPRNEGRALLLRGALTLDAYLKPSANRWSGELHLASAEGGLRIGDRARRELLRYDNFSLDISLDPRSIQGRLGTGFDGDGYVDARFQTGWEDNSPLTGELYTYMAQLFWLELFSPDLVRPRGVVRGHVSVRGTRGQPAMGGQLLLEDFRGELPALGLDLSEGKGSFDAQPDGSASINASVRSGEGTLTVDGGLSWYGQATPLQLAIRGQQVLVSDTPMLHAVASPDLQFSVVDGTMVLRGEVDVPSAEIRLDEFESGVGVSEDVVVVDPVDPEEGPDTPLDMDLALKLGDDVRLSGYGLDGTLAGRLQVRARPGREMTGTGALEVGGRYEAYGQKLVISRGQMTWSNNLISDPRINLRAERKVSEVTAGIDVTGHAAQPRVRVWSEPSMSQSEALSYLMLGRSLQGISSNQAQQVSNASAALSAGTGLLASRLGAKLGFDDAGVTQSRSLGGSVVGVGKYITPKLYIGYGVSMVGSGSVVILKYLLRKGFDLEIESSTVETRGSVNWRQER